MILRKYVLTQRKLKILLLLIVFILITLTLLFLKFDKQPYLNPNEQFEPKQLIIKYSRNFVPEKLQSEEKLKNVKTLIVPEKYNEHEIKTRLIQEKIKYLTFSNNKDNKLSDNDATVITTNENSPRIHIFYEAPVKWSNADTINYKKLIIRLQNNDNSSVSNNVTNPETKLHVAYYPFLGPYKQTTTILKKHFENLNQIGVGVIIVNFNDVNKKLIDEILKLLPKYNLTLTFSIKTNDTQTMDDIVENLKFIQNYYHHRSFFKVYSIQKCKNLPLIYIADAYKIKYNMINRNDKQICSTNNFNNDMILIGHIRLKEHADKMRRLCFNGFYTKIPSNGAYFASTWKNWSYLKRFALMYNLLFIPTVGPGFKTMKKTPRHGDLHKDRSNGQYYGFAWRTAIINHVGFINIASYNNWLDGTQIEEVIPSSGFDSYEPGKPRKYLDLTAHWINNFLLTKRKSLSTITHCLSFLNNSIC